MQWSQISASEKYKTLTPEQQAKVQDGYFNQYIAPKAQEAGFDPEEARTKFRQKIGAVAMPESATEDQPGFLSNAARLAGERAGDLAGNLTRGIRQAGDYLEEKMPLGGVVFDGGMPRYVGAEEYKAKTEGKPQALDQVAQAAESIDLGGESRHNPETVKDQWNKGNYGSAAGEALKFGGESFIQSIPDMAAVIASLPLYVGARATEMGTARAENKGKSEADISDTAEALPFALGSALLERIVPSQMLKGITGKQVAQVGEEVTKAVVPRIAKEAAKGATKEALTEMFQEGLLEYVGERYGTGAQMSLAEALEQGAWASLAGGIGGGAMGGVGGIRAPRRPPAGLEYKPQRMITMPDGTTAWESEADQLRDMGAASQHPAYARAQTPILDQTPEQVEQELGANTPADDELDLQIKELVAEVEGLDLELNPPEAPQILPGALERGAELAQAEQMVHGPQILPGAMERPAFNPEPVDAIQDIQSPQALVSEQALVPIDAQPFTKAPVHQAKPNKPAYLRVNPARDELLMAIAKLGGISQEEAKAQGIDPAHFRDRVGWNNPFRKQGKTLDEMAEALAQEGYLPQNYSANELLDKVSGSLSGRKNYTPQGVEYWTAKERFDEEALRAMEGDDVESLAQLVDPEIKSTPEAEADPAIKTLAHLIDDAIEAGASLSRIQEITRDDNLTFNQTAGILVALTHEARRANELQDNEGELAGGNGSRESDPAIEGVTLTGEESVRFLNELFGITDEAPILDSYSEQDLAARQKADADRQQAEKLAQSKAEQDARHSDFTLTGSDRPADLAAARGQNDLFTPQRKVEAAAAESALSPLNDLPEPTDAQKEAGNYKKGKTRLHGLEISIENPRGSKRSGVDQDGKPWSVEMRDHYGYIRRSAGADGEQVDVFIGPNPESEKVYVVDQINPDDSFDEHKVVMGYDSKLKARAGYRDNYSKDWKVGPITEMTMDEFKSWLRDGDTTKPLNQDHFADAGKLVTSSQPIVDSSPQSITSQKAQPAPSNSIAESEVVYSGYERETSSLQVQQSKQRGGHPPAQIDLFAPLRVPSATARTQAKDNFYVLFEQVGTQEFATGIDTVTSARDLAHVVAPLRKHAQESMIAVVTDDQGKILNVIRHTKGQKDSSDVGPVELMAAVASTKGGTRVWLAHNHPSGTTKPSQADRRITAHLDSISETLGIRPMGHVIVAPGSTRAAFFKSDGTVDDQVIIRPSARTKRVELTERVLRKRGKLENISSARDAKRIASNLESEDALILLSNSNDVVGVVNISKDEMKSLKTRGGTRRIFSALDKTNANAVIIKTKDREAAANVSKFLNGFDGEVRILDWLRPTDDGSSYISDAEGGSGTIRSSGLFHSKSEKVSRAKGVPIDQLQQITADFFDRYPGARAGTNVRIYGDDQRAFGPNLPERDRGKIKGGFNPETGDLVLIAANLDGAADAQETLQHEILVHHGMGFLPEAEITEALNTVKKAILEDRQVNKIWQEIERTYRGEPEAKQLEEVLARIAEKLDTGTWARTWNNVLLAIRKALAKLGLIKPLTRLEDLKAIIYDFAEAFEQGKSPGRREGSIRQSRKSGTQSLADIRKQLESEGIRLGIYERSDSIVVSKIVVPSDQRNQGLGTAAMQSLIDYADSAGKRIELSPSSDFGGNKLRLRRFYKRLGFVENSGPNKDFAISETMYREPRPNAGVSRSGVDQTETAAFKKWFGDSKVVDANGKPLVVYHGTNADFSVFRTDNDLGAHFGTREQAAIFAENEGSILPVYLAINNPLRLVDNGDFYPVRVVPQLQKLGILPDVVYPSQFSGESGVRAIQTALKNAGFDGVVYANQREGKGDSYIAFDPKQIKSATGNTGTFDPDNPDIRFSRAPNSEPRPSAGVSVSERLKKVIPKTKAQKELAQQRAKLDSANRSAFDQLGDKDKTIFQRVRTEVKRQLTPGGLLPKDVFDLKILRDGKMNADEIESRVRIGAFKAAVQKAYGKPYEKLEPAVKARINAALRGEQVLVPAAVREQIGFMRDEIKRLSAIHVQQLMDDIKQLTRDAKKQMVKAKEIESESGIDPVKQTGDPDAIREYLELLGDETKQFSARGKIAEAKKKAALLKTIAENFDTYLHRSYRAFDDPNWPKKVPAKVYAEAVDYLAAGYAGDKLVTEDHRDRARKKAAMMLQEGTAFDSMGAFISEGKLGAKDLSIIKRRQDIAPQIRALLGEYEDAPINYAKSVAKMGRLVYNHDFLKQMMEVGKAQGFLLEKQNLDLKATKKIAGDASEVYAPLNGLYTQPEFDQALKDALGKENMADWYRAIVAVNGFVKFGKTVLSPTTAMRNFYSAMFFALANGHFNFKEMRKSLGILKTYFRDADDDGKEYMKKLRTLGVIYDSPYASEMMELLKDSRLEDLDRWWNPISRLKAPIDFAQRFYSYGDDFWKIIGFENEKALLMKHKGMSEPNAEKEAAERIRNTYPTYSMTGRAVNALRRFPLAGTFVSFPAEVIRTSYHITRYLAQDLKDSRAMGMQKLAGYAIAGGAIAGLSALSKAWFAVDDDEEDALKTLAPEWQKNSNFLYWGRDERGQLRYMDLSFLDPYNYWKRPINAFLRDQTAGEAAVDGTWEMLKPFFGQDILFQAVTEAITNEKQTGSRVFNPEDSAGNQLLDISKHLGKAVQPGFASNIGRMWEAHQGTVTASGKQFSMDEELAALAGFRLGTFDPKTALYYQTFGFQDRKRSASMLLTTAMRDPNKKSNDDLRDAYERAMTARDRAFRDMLKVVNAAKKAGMSEMQIRVTLKNSGVSKQDSAWLARGEVPPWKPSSTMMSGAIRKAAVLFDEETADEFRRREDFIKRLNRDAQR